MSKILFFILLGIAVIVGSVIMGIQKTPPTVPGPTDKVQGVKFTGTITETNNGCWADGICSIKVDDK